MSIFWRMVISIFDLLFFLLSGAAIAVSIGWTEPLAYINMAFATSQNRIITGSVAVLIFVLVLLLQFMCLKRNTEQNTVDIEAGNLGKISITISAVKLIIMKAIREVQGIKEVKPYVKNIEGGLLVNLHMMVNPGQNVPEMVIATQEKVKDYLENIGGLQVAEIKVLVDDINKDSK